MRWALGAGAAILAVALWSALGHPFDDDEFQHLHAAWAMWHGQRPYVDFFEHHLLAAHAAIAPLVGPAEGPWPLFALRVVGAMLLLASIGAWAGIARRCGVRVPVVAGAALLVASVPMLVLKATEVRPAVPALALHAACAWVLYARPGRRWAALAGLLAGAMILCSQKFIYAASGLWAAAWALRGFTWSALMAALGAACGGAWLAICAALGILGPMWDSVVVMNLHWKRSFSPGPYLTALYRSAPLLLAAGVLGTLERRLDRQRVAVLLILGAGILQVAMVPVPFRQTFLPLFGPLMVLAAIALDRIAARVPRPVLAVAVLAGCVPGIASLGEQIAPGHAEDRARMALVDATAAPGAPVFDGRGLLFWRPHVGHHACMHEGIQLMLDEAVYGAETAAAIEAAGFPLAIVDYRVEAMPLAIRELLAAAYLPLEADPTVLQPGLSVPRNRLGRRGTTIQLPLAGRWRVTWIGGDLRIDGDAVESGSVLELEAGDHELVPRGLVRGLEFRLERGDGP